MPAVTLQRIKERWPRARIGVLTDAPLLLHGYFPKAEAITVGGRSRWAAPTRAERLAARAGANVIEPPALRGCRGRPGCPGRQPECVAGLPGRICRSAQPEATWGCDEVGKRLRLSRLSGRSADRVARSGARRWVSDRC
jgi:hypothetical protein